MSTDFSRVTLGLTVQSRQREILTVLHRPIRHHHLSVVGAAPGLYLCQSSGHALAWFWLLRLLLHHPYPGFASDRPSFLLVSIQICTGNLLGGGRLLISGHHYNYRRYQGEI